ncbi:hypothetical protein HPB52_008820 [Rhipicephalus sanguineus]|uniref:Uncharacterized protein n=1 Tax=Rhipicephalus sanguineus TaxID=34632 RepID=A0A9D4QJ40_RHISA|nr:hypothetical protein HPB52_008820 [Rhipicephalus sanguineus]
MLMNIRQVRRRRFTRSENTYEAGSSSSVPFSWNSLIRESLLQTSWPISLSADSDDDEFDLFNPRRLAKAKPLSDAVSRPHNASGAQWGNVQHLPFHRCASSSPRRVNKSLRPSVLYLQ